MPSHPQDRTDERIDDSVTVDTADTDGRPVTHEEPIGADGQPIFPPEPADSARLLPDSTGYVPPVADSYADPAHDPDVVSPEESYSAAPIPGDVDDATFAPAAETYPTAAPTAAGTYPPAADDAPLVPVPEPPSALEAEPAHLADSGDEAWLSLQGAFVDDPAQAVRDAGDRVEQQLATLRSRLDSADTEQLRTAFKQFRAVSAALR